MQKLGEEDLINMAKKKNKSEKGVKPNFFIAPKFRICTVGLKKNKCEYVTRSEMIDLSTAPSIGQSKNSFNITYSDSVKNNFKKLNKKLFKLLQ